MPKWLFLLTGKFRGNKLDFTVCFTLHMALESLKQLEAKINGFLARHEQICSEKEDLFTRLQERELAYAALLEQLRQYERERNEIRTRLEKILNRFAGLEEYMKSEG
jgi:hypothetical protein